MPGPEGFLSEKSAFPRFSQPKSCGWAILCVRHHLILWLQIHHCIRSTIVWRSRESFPKPQLPGHERSCTNFTIVSLRDSAQLTDRLRRGHDRLGCRIHCSRLCNVLLPTNNSRPIASIGRYQKLDEGLVLLLKVVWQWLFRDNTLADCYCCSG